MKKNMHLYDAQTLKYAKMRNINFRICIFMGV